MGYDRLKDTDAYILRLSETEFGLIKAVFAESDDPLDPEAEISVRTLLKSYPWETRTLREKIDRVFKKTGDGVAKCLNCGRTFVRPYGVTTQYCCNRCRGESKPIKDMYKVCPVCGKAFKIKGNKKFCSHECREAYAYDRKIQKELEWIKNNGGKR